MKIAVVIPKYGLVGGAETFVFEVCERLALHKEFEIHVFANKWQPGQGQIVFHKVPIVRFPHFLAPISFAYFANSRIRQDDYTLVHSHERIFEMDLLTFHGIPHKTWIKNARKRPLTFFDHATAWVEKKGFKNNKLKIVMPVSSLVQEEIQNGYGFLGDKLLVNPPGVDIERFSVLDSQQCRQEIFMRFGFSLKDVVVLFVSMNFELKRLDLVLRGIADLISRDKRETNLKLLVVGKGDVKRFGKLASDLGISDRVVFTGVTREVENYYMAADIFIMPSRLDTFGLVVLEAMAAGLPVIISRNVGARDLVEPGVNGYVLSKDPSISELATALSLLLEPEMRKLMGENGKKVACLHSWDKTAGRVADLYRQLAG